MRLNSKKVVLFLPAYSGPVLGPPASLLALASPLRAAGYDVTVLDAAILPDPLPALSREAADAICVGISVLTGPMILGAIRAGRTLRRLRSDLPIVFGGWHPSLLPDQTLREPFVDIVVRNQGELTFLEVVRRIEQGRSLEGVAGCSFKTDAGAVHNPDRSVSRIDSLPPPAFDLADFDAYEAATGERKLPYASSVGCPYACNYCTDTVFYNRRFNAYPAGRVVREVTQLVDRLRIREVALLDSNFLVDTHRAAAIARGFVDSGHRFSWTFQASTDLLCRMSDEEVGLLGHSGVTHIGFGTESASEPVLISMNKLHQRVADMFETARKCKDAGIRVTFNLILGYPGESDADRRETLSVMGRIAQRFDSVTFSPNIFTPYPAIPVWPELRALGVREPESLEQWAALPLSGNMLPWLRGERLRSLQGSMSVFMLNNHIVKKMRRNSHSPLGRRILRTLQKPLLWRLRHHYFGWPLELWLARAKKRVVMRRSLLTGRALGHSLTEVS